MERIGLDATYPGMTWDEESVDVEVVVVQDGPAVWVEQEVVMKRTRSFGFSRETMLLQAHCPSQLEVPLLASVRTLDGATEVVLEGTGHLADPGAGTVGDLPWVHLVAPYEALTYPSSDADPDDYEDKHALIDLSYHDAGFTSGSVGWTGVNDAEAVRRPPPGPSRHERTHVLGAAYPSEAHAGPASRRSGRLGSSPTVVRGGLGAGLPLPLCPPPTSPSSPSPLPLPL